MEDRGDIEGLINQEYQRVLEFCEKSDVPDYMLVQSKEYLDGRWRDYKPLVDYISDRIENSVVVDFGCKYGHLLPYLSARGASEVIGLDAEPEYVSIAKAVFEETIPHCKCALVEKGLIPLQQKTVDVIFANEVISHVNPAYLDIVFSEWARILKPGGVVFISDGNNAANQLCIKKLLPLYEAWENGPDGRHTDRDYVQKSYLTRRKEIIRNLTKSLSEDQVQYLALNTSGLFGEVLEQEIMKYVETGELVERPYRSGTYPTNPSEMGVVMERAFHPFALEKHLFTYGIFAKQILPTPPSFEGKDLFGKINTIVDQYQYYKMAYENPDHARGASEIFRMLGRKVW